MWKHLRGDHAGLAGLVLLAAIVLAAMLGPGMVPYDPLQPNLQETFLSPSGSHALGTDQLGRDLLARVVTGARLSLGGGLAALALSLAIGVPAGLVAGYAGGRTDDAIMSVVEVLMSFPGPLLAILAVAVLGPSQQHVVLAPVWDRGRLHIDHNPLGDHRDLRLIVDGDSSPQDCQGDCPIHDSGVEIQIAQLGRQRSSQGRFAGGCRPIDGDGARDHGSPSGVGCSTPAMSGRTSRTHRSGKVGASRVTHH